MLKLSLVNMANWTLKTVTDMWMLLQISVNLNESLWILRNAKPSPNGTKLYQVIFKGIIYIYTQYFMMYFDGPPSSRSREHGTRDHTYMHASIHSYIHRHTYLSTYLHTYIPTYLRTYVPTYTRTYILYILYRCNFGVTCTSPLRPPLQRRPQRAPRPPPLRRLRPRPRVR